MGGDWGPVERVLDALAEDEHEWVPEAMAGVWIRPLLFNTVRGA